VLREEEARMASFAERLEQEKLEALKELAYGAGHEINNPLANIAARAQTLLEDERDPERRRKLLAIHRQAMRAHEMIADLMLFARPPQLNVTQFDLRQVVSGAVDELRDMAAEREIAMTCDVGEAAIVVTGDETQLGVAVAAVVKNAVEAVGANGQVDVEVRQVTVAEESWAEVIVHDDGPGISAEVRCHLFDPFFSGREAGRGLGFGLSKCWRIVTEHGGQVVVNSEGGRGAEFKISLPLSIAHLSASP
jgi:signal transduction histidine kinase